MILISLNRGEGWEERRQVGKREPTMSAPEAVESLPDVETIDVDNETCSVMASYLLQYYEKSDVASVQRLLKRNCLVKRYKIFGEILYTNDVTLFRICFDCCHAAPVSLYHMCHNTRRVIVKGLLDVLAFYLDVFKVPLESEEYAGGSLLATATRNNKLDVVRFLLGRGVLPSPEVLEDLLCDIVIADNASIFDEFVLAGIDFTLPVRYGRGTMAKGPMPLFEYSFIDGKLVVAARLFNLGLFDFTFLKWTNNPIVYQFLLRLNGEVRKTDTKDGKEPTDRVLLAFMKVRKCTFNEARFIMDAINATGEEVQPSIDMILFEVMSGW